MAFQWVLDERKYLTTCEVRRLTRAARALSRSDGADGVRAWLLVDLVSESGLRVGEVAGLCVGDVMVHDGRRSILVRRGKGGKSRVVRIGRSLASHLCRFLSWKARRGEPVESGSALLWSSRVQGAYSRRALQLMFKRCARSAGLPGYVSVHCLRHTYAVHLYKASGYNLRLVQKQLGHSSVRTTEVYADVFDADLVRAVDCLYGK